MLKAYELFRSSGAAQTIDDFYQNNENNPIEIAGIFNEINEEDKVNICPVGTCKCQYNL